MGAVVALSLIGVTLVGVFGAAVWQQQTRVQIDRETLCPKAGPSALTVILVDATDGMSAVQRTAIETRLDEVVTRLREYEEVQVYSIEAGASLLKPDFRVCRPKSPDNVNDWTGNKNLARLQFEEVFRPRLRKVLEDAMNRPASNASPIMEAVQQVVVGAFQKADVGAGAGGLPKRLVIVSDMLEHGKGGSHYAGVPDFAAFRETQAYRSLKADMDGIVVEVLYLLRPEAHAVQGTTAHLNFWKAYFETDQNARMPGAIPIEG